MKNVIALLLVLCSSCFAYSQDDLIKAIQRLTLANDSLQKQVLKPLQDSILRLNANSTAQVSKMQKQIDSLTQEKMELNKKIKDLKKENDSLNKNSVKIERDSLKKQADQLTVKVAEERKLGDQKAKSGKENGRKEILDSIVGIYKTEKFDSLIKNSTKQSVQRDMQLVGNSAEVKLILSDLEKYFNAEELLSQKYDATQSKEALIQLSQIKRESTFLNKLKENTKFYKNFGDELRKAIEKLVDLDRKKVAAGDAEIQKLKFNDIMSVLSSYIYDYYEFGHYPYLSDIVFEIIKRKQPNADADITDLLKKM